jgi:hypothetical protein
MTDLRKPTACRMSVGTFSETQSDRAGLGVTPGKEDRRMKPKNRYRILGVLAAGVVLAFGTPAFASSHREAPAITASPKVDATDFYMFNSYEAGRAGMVTIVADYLPLQDAYGGPNFFTLDPSATYEIKLDNDGDSVEDLTFQFRFKTTRKDIALDVGGVQVAVPVINVGPIGPGDTAALNVLETFSVDLVRGAQRSHDRRQPQPVVNVTNGSPVFVKPVDNIGAKSIPDYPGYAAQFVYDIAIPGCTLPGRMFVGQRRDPFAVNLGETFDLVNIRNPLGPTNAERSDLEDKNVSALALELPASCLVSSGSPVIAGWTTARLRDSGATGRADGARLGLSDAAGGSRQVSRLGNPLVNEAVIGLKDKDAFNASDPADDARFLKYVTNPTLPKILEILFGAAGVRAPTQFPRADLVAVFLTGVDGVNKTAGAGEMLRLNTSIPAKPAEAQNNLGVIGGDLAGFPNGRRPGDDVVDVALRVLMGKLLSADVAPSGQLPFTDGAYVDAAAFNTHFPYLLTPIAGSPQQ